MITKHCDRLSTQKKVASSLATMFSPAFLALSGATVVGLFTLGVSLPAEAVMVANYQFNSTLSSAVPTAADLVPFTLGSFTLETIGGATTTVYNFGKQQGLSLNTTGLITDNYTIAALFRFNSISSWRKVLDFKNLASDYGFYLYGGQLNFFFETSGGPSVLPGAFLEAVLTRDSSTNLVTAYFDGSPVFSFTDSSSSGVISAANLLNIFQDDVRTGGSESSSGSVAGIQIFNTVLTDAEVADLDLVTPVVPAPLPIVGFAAAFGWSRNLRRRLRGS